VGRTAAFLRLVRPVNSLMMGFATVVGAFLTHPGPVSGWWFKGVLAFVTAFTLTGASMTLNDYYDREIDAVNEPDRPIPSGLVKPREALAMTTVLTVVGLASAYLTNLWCLLLASISCAVSFTYSTRGKATGLPGNMMVSTCVAVPFLYGGLAVGGGLTENLAIFSAMAFLVNTGREVTKGIVDVEGDAMKGFRTVAISMGPASAAWVSSAFYVTAIGMSVVPYVLDTVSSWYVPPMAVACGGLAYSTASLLREHSRENARRVKHQVLAWMLVGLIAFLLGSL